MALCGQNVLNYTLNGDSTNNFVKLRWRLLGMYISYGNTPNLRCVSELWSWFFFNRSYNSIICNDDVSVVTGISDTPSTRSGLVFMNYLFETKVAIFHGSVKCACSHRVTSGTMFRVWCSGHQFLARHRRILLETASLSVGHTFLKNSQKDLISEIHNCYRSVM